MSIAFGSAFARKLLELRIIPDSTSRIELVIEPDRPIELNLRCFVSEEQMASIEQVLGSEDFAVVVKRILFREPITGKSGEI
jgi:hypothetical protein